MLVSTRSRCSCPFVRRLAPARSHRAARDRTADPGSRTGARAGDRGALRGAMRVMVASSDLSHYHDAATARALDGEVIAAVEAFDPDRLQDLLDRRPEHACGGGPIVAVMRAAQVLGARDAVALNYADSGDVSGDKSAVVGYLAAAFGVR